MHLADAGNCELFAPVLAYSIVAALRAPLGRLAAFGVVGTIAAYAPFYFDGNYPGGGARLYADVLPLEHLLLAFALVRFGWSALALPVAFAGFALHTVYDHARLASREGGRPLYEPAVVRQAGVARGLVFVDTDHGFDLGFDPAAFDEPNGIVVARRRGDAHDALLWRELGRPTAYAYEQSLVPGAPRARLVPLTMTIPPVARFEGEAEWPPLAVDGGFVQPIFPPCASARRALALRPTSERLRVRIEAPPVSASRYRIATAWVTPASGRTRVKVTLMGISWEVAEDTAPSTCRVSFGPVLDITQHGASIDLFVGSEQALDYVEAMPIGP
jgi:hypothetical protein